MKQKFVILIIFFGLVFPSIGSQLASSQSNHNTNDGNMYASMTFTADTNTPYFMPTINTFTVNDPKSKYDPFHVTLDWNWVITDANMYQRVDITLYWHVWSNIPGDNSKEWTYPYSTWKLPDGGKPGESNSLHDSFDWDFSQAYVNRWEIRIYCHVQFTELEWSLIDNQWHYVTDGLNYKEDYNDFWLSIGYIITANGTSVMMGDGSSQYIQGLSNETIVSGSA